MVGSTVGRSSNTGMELYPTGRLRTAMKELADPVSMHLMSADEAVGENHEFFVYYLCSFGFKNRTE